MKLYDYYRSTACYRVRIALNIKHISYEIIPVHLVHEAQHQPEYLAINPQGLVPSIEQNGHFLSQSLAIIEYLEEITPTPALLPHCPLNRAQVRSLAMAICCDIHPLNNLRVLHQLREQFQATEEQINTWYHHWLKVGFDAIEKRLQEVPHKKHTCYGSELSLADICLIPQVYNAKRFNFPLDNYPRINEINDYCMTLTPFIKASPEKNEFTDSQTQNQATAI